MTGATIVQIIAIALALFLALRALNTRRLSGTAIGLQALVWVAIIGALTAIISLLTRT